jgi:hypothetical protein
VFDRAEQLADVLAAGRFLKEVSADDLVWGNQFEKPIRVSLAYQSLAASAEAVIRTACRGARRRH